MNVSDLKTFWKRNKRNFLGFLFLIGFGLGIYVIAFPVEKPSVTAAFYYWESDQHSLDEKEKKVLEKQHVQKLYVKFFEVDKNEANRIIPISKSELELVKTKEEPVEIIPTIYIRNVVFKNTSKTEILELVDHLIHLVKKRYSEQFKGFGSFKELQIDCDWTLSTTDNYHYFLRELKKKTKVQLSATLRLYPYKFPDKMGVLPVDRAMLMCYNLLPPLESGNRNSILDNTELAKYLIGAKPYPIPLDVALPVFSNVLVYKHEHFNSIIHTRIAELKNYTKHDEGPWYYVVRDTTVTGVFLHQGDKLRVENIEKKRLNEAIRLIRKNVSFKGDMTVALFYLNTQQLQSYDTKTLRTCFTSFNR